MSSYGYTHIGYYLIGKVRTVPSDETVDQCERDANHKNIGHGAYCPECGGMIVSVPSTETTELDFQDIPLEEFDGEMYDELYTPEYIAPEGTVIAISNYSAGRLALDDDEGSKIFEEDDIDKAVLYDEFMDKHAKHVSLISKYVLDDVQIKFGIFRYYM